MTLKEMNVGDIVEGKDIANGRYTITKKGSVLKVLRINKNRKIFKGKLLSHPKGNIQDIGVTFTLQAEYFKMHNAALNKISKNYNI